METLHTDSSREWAISGNIKNSLKGNCVLYIMSRDQRISDNYALYAAQQKALTLSVPLAVVFCLHNNSKGRAREYVEWMLEGLQQIEKELQRHNIAFLCMIGDHVDRILSLLYYMQPAIVYGDYTPLNGVKRWQEIIAQHVPFVRVDTHNCVPVWVVSSRQEYSARTIRPKIHRYLQEYIEAKPMRIVKHPHMWPGSIIPMRDMNELIHKTVSLYPSNSIKSIQWESGEKAAYRHLEKFIKLKLANYKTDRNNPAVNGLSDVSPYLHFGMISSLQVVRALKVAVRNNPSLGAAADTLIEEMVIRKELADNYCHYNAGYRSLAGAPEWAQRTLQKHAHDPRDYVYTYEQLENAQTHDFAWNAAQIQLRKSGKMHGYMRMYWAKKVLEWSEYPEQAVQTLIRMNDFYSIDGGDPNGYVGILWSVAGLHDRPWTERPIYGTVRSMVYSGLRRKFAIRDYEQKWVS